MSKAFRKPRPSIPKWEWLNRDGCWFCKLRNCSNCKANKKVVAEQKKKQRRKHLDWREI